MIVPIADLIDNRKETSVMVLGQWMLMSHDKRKIRGWVTFGGNQKGKIARIGDIDLKHNLLNISQLCDSGYDVSFNKG
ncbi:hypothetical protein CR513_25821, partial [Mucuna pruriens]